MKTRVIKVRPDFVEPDKLEEIVSVLRKEGIIVYPTETFYGLGVNIFVPRAIHRVYRLKKRDPSRPLPVVISDPGMLRDVIMDLPSVYEPLISAFWPGPLTVILKASPGVPETLQGSSGTVGVRLTGYKWLRALIRRAGFPLTATSANLSGEAEISDPEKAFKLFEGKVHLMVDGGKTRGFLPSTVVDLTGDKPRLVREGAVSSLRLREFLPTLSDQGTAK